MVAGVEFPHEETRCRFQNRDVFTEALVLRLEPFDLGVLDRRDAVAGAVVDVGLQHPPAHGFVADTDLAGYGRLRGRQRGILRPVLPHQPHRPVTERGIDLLRHDLHPSNSKGCGIKPGALHVANRAGIFTTPATTGTVERTGPRKRPSSTEMKP